MSRREAERFEQVLQQAERRQDVDAGLRPLVETARLVAALAQSPPEPAYSLAPGRQRFLAEAAAYRAQSSQKQGVRLPWAVRLGMAAVAAILVFGLLLGAGQAIADSLPGEPLHGAELALEQARLTLTLDSRSRAELRLALAEERLDELVSLAAQGRTLDDPALTRAEDQLLAALEEAAQLGGTEAASMLERLELAVQHRQRMMAGIAEGLPEPEQIRLQETFQLMEQVRREAQSGQADPERLRERLRQGVPSEPAMPPDPGSDVEPSDADKGSGLDPEIQPGLGPRPSEEALGQDEEKMWPDPHRQPTPQEMGGGESGGRMGPGSRPTVESIRESESRRAKPGATDRDTERDAIGMGPMPGPRPTGEAMEEDQSSAEPKPDPRPTDGATGTACPSPQPPGGEDKVDERTGDPNPGPQPPDSRGEGDGRGDGPAPQPPDDRREGDERDTNPGPQPPTEGGEGNHRGDDAGTGSRPPDDSAEGDGHNREAEGEPGKGP